jgi:hypothetical protein
LARSSSPSTPTRLSGSPSDPKLRKEIELVAGSCSQLHMPAATMGALANRCSMF